MKTEGKRRLNVDSRKRVYRVNGLAVYFHGKKRKWLCVDSELGNRVLLEGTEDQCLKFAANGRKPNERD